MMGPQEIAALADAMAETGVGRLELTGPDVALTLARGGAGTTAKPVAAAEPDVVPVTSPSLGMFLRRHPLHEAPLATDGAAVVAGQPVALLRVGDLLTPVVAPADGIVVAAVPEEGALVGYGDRLFDFLPND